MKTVRDIVTEWLRTNGYDGLVEKDGECGCRLEDLFPCGDVYAQWCVAGHEVKCTCGAGCGWHIKPGKRETPQTIDDSTP